MTHNHNESPLKSFCEENKHNTFTYLMLTIIEMFCTIWNAVSDYFICSVHSEKIL